VVSLHTSEYRDYFGASADFSNDSGIDAGVKYRPKTVQEIAKLGPEYTKRWEEKFAGKEDKPVYVMMPGAL
jgi:hypothetical protein